MTSDSEREARIRALLPLVRRIAKRLKLVVPAVDLGDLVGDGSVGLIAAVDRFDPTRGPSLDAYARRMIAGAMLNGIRRMDPVSERARRLVRDGDALRARRAIERGCSPTAAEIECERPGYQKAVAAAHRGTPLSLDIALPDGESLPLDWQCDPARIVAQQQLYERLGTTIDGLTQRQRSVVHEYYFGDRSLRDIGRRLGVSPQRVSQLHRTAVQHLRNAFDAASP